MISPSVIAVIAMYLAVVYCSIVFLLYTFVFLNVIIKAIKDDEMTMMIYIYCSVGLVKTALYYLILYYP